MIANVTAINRAISAIPKDANADTLMNFGNFEWLFTTLVLFVRIFSLSGVLIRLEFEVKTV